MLTDLVSHYSKISFYGMDLGFSPRTVGEEDTQSRNTIGEGHMSKFLSNVLDSHLKKESYTDSVGLHPQKSQAAMRDRDHRHCRPGQGWADLKPVNGQLLAFCEKSILSNVIVIYHISLKSRLCLAGHISRILPASQESRMWMGNWFVHMCPAKFRTGFLSWKT